MFPTHRSDIISSKPKALNPKDEDPPLKKRDATWRPRGLSKSVRSRVIIRVTPFRVLITLLMTHLTLNPKPLNP